jgi:hypothetical protein
MAEHIKVITFKYIRGASRALNTILKAELQETGWWNQKKCESLYVCPEKIIHFWMR